MSTMSRTWGTTHEDRSLAFPCDRLLEKYDDVYYRGVTINAPAAVVYKWLCQMRAAPYSYDWLDNFGRKSPQHLIEGLDQIEIGQSVMTIFRVIDFEPGRYLTVRIRKRSDMLGDSVICYMIVPENGNVCRVLVKLIIKYPRGILGKLVKLILPMGDLVMMRRQLLNFKQLSEDVIR